jgi:plastin-1
MSFSDEQVEHMRQLFRYCDKDGSGSIDKEELGSVMHELGKDLSEEELSTLMAQLDADGSGSIDFDEFLEGMGKWFLGPAAGDKQEQDNDFGLEADEIAEARKIFDAVDKDGSGKIDSSELKEAMQQAGRDATDEDVRALMKRLNVEGDEIDFETFCRGFHSFMGGGGADDEPEEKGTSFDEVQINQYREIFKLFDRDGSGTIDIQEMRSVLNELGKKVDNKELEKLMNDLDNDGSGEIDFDEFLKGMERLDQLTAAPDVFQTEEEQPKQEKISRLQEDVKELKKQNRLLQNKCQVYENEVNYYTNINQQQQDELSEKTRELERLRKDYKSSQNLKEINKDLTAEIDTLRQELKKARDAQEKLKRLARTTSVMMDKEKDELAKLQMATKDTEIDKLKAQVKALNKGASVIEEELDRFRNRNDQLENEAVKLRLQAAALLGLQDAHHLLQTQHEEYVALLDEARAKIFVLEGRLEEYANMQPTQPITTIVADSTASLANEIEAGASQSVAQAEAEAQALRAEAATLRAEASAMRAEAARLREEKLAKDHDLSDARLELATLRRTSESTTAEMAALKTEKSSIESELVSFKASSSIIEAELQSTKLEKASLLADQSALFAENKALKEKIVTLEETIRKLEEELRSLRGAMHEESKQMEELLEKNKKLATELNDLNDIVMQASKASSQEPLDQEDTMYIHYINFILKDDIQIAQLLPIGDREVDVSSSCVDGVILCKLINKAVPGTIDERVLKLRPKNKTDVIQNHNLCLNSAMAIGCNVPASMSQSLLEGNVPDIMTFISEIVKIGLLSSVSLAFCRELVQLKEENESGKQFLNLLPEMLLLRWVNYHLKRSGVAPVTNLSLSIKDGVVYNHLLHQLYPQKSIAPAAKADSATNISNVITTLDNLMADNITPAAIFLTKEMISSGHGKMNLLGIACLFRANPAIAALEPSKSKVVDEISVEFSSEGTREERAFKFWMQSLGVQVRSLADDVQDGLVILQVLDKISPGIVDWKSVNSNRAKMNAFNKLENCNYCVKLGKELKFSMVGIAGKDFVDGNKKFILALVWQTMRHHIFSILKQLKFGGKEVTEDDMISWANNKVLSAGKKSVMKDFRDKSLGDGLFLIDLLYGLDPSGVDYALVTPGDTTENKILNAKYAISLARKLGCCVFLLPEDIIEVKSKLLLTFVGTLMSVDR